VTWPAVMHLELHARDFVGSNELGKGNRRGDQVNSLISVVKENVNVV